MTDSRSFTLQNARLVLPDGIETASLGVRDGYIDGFARTVPEAPDHNCGGDYILPGLIELHTDNLERHIEPRPGTFRAPARALFSHDAELAAAGITTAFDAITVGAEIGSETRDRANVESVRCIGSSASAGLLRIEHLLHVRCELSDRNLADRFPHIGTYAEPRLLSLMDHTPGQGQWEDVERFRHHYALRYGLSSSQIDDLIARRQAAHQELAAPNRAHALAFAREHACVIASHDVATPEDVHRAQADGCTLVEFPTSLLAASEARRLKLSIVAGAPNLVRGSSHSGNVSACTLAEKRLIDVLSSDYCPPTLLESVFLLSELHELPLHRAVAAATDTPAQLLRLNDRGSLRPGYRADLVRVRETMNGPVIVSAWCAGRQVA